jgi:hypothetical protein
MKTLKALVRVILISLALADAVSAGEPGATLWKVTIHMYSGARNPVFELEESEERRLVSEAVEAAKAPDAAWIDEGSNTLLPNKLGYTGLSIFEVGEDGSLRSQTEIVGRRALVRILGLDPRVVPLSEDLELRLLAVAASKGVIRGGMREHRELIAQRDGAADSPPPSRDGHPSGHSMKGWEIYSWQEPSGDWLYALVIGTNRLKGEVEIRSAAVTEQVLRRQLEELPARESVFLHCAKNPPAPQLSPFRDLVLERPPKEVLDSLAELGSQRGLEISFCD